MLLILPANATFYAKADLLAENALLGTTPVRHLRDLGRFTASITSSTVLANIINFDSPFQPSKDLVHQALQGFHRGPFIKALPLHLQTDADKVMIHFLTICCNNDLVRPDAVRLRLNQFFKSMLPPPSVPAPSSAPHLAAMLARDTYVPRLSADSGRSSSDAVLQSGPPEVALLARQGPDSRLDSRPPSRQDLRPDGRQDCRPNSRPNHGK